MYKVLLFLNIIIISVACNNVLHSKENSTVKDEDSTDQSNPFIFTPSGGEFITFNHYDTKYARFVTSFNIENHTGSKITYLKLGGFLEIQFQNEGLMFIPSSWKNDISEDEYIQSYSYSTFGMLGGITAKRQNPIAISNPWLQNEIIPITFNVPLPDPMQAGETAFELPLDYFQRTPETVNFIVLYTARGVDGEYSDIERFDILDQWKDYQRELGLR